MVYKDFNTRQISQISLWDRIALAFTKSRSVCDFDYPIPVKTTFKVRKGVTYIMGMSRIKGYKANGIH